MTRRSAAPAPLPTLERPVDSPLRSPYLEVSLDRSGHVTVRGDTASIRAFLRRCRRRGLLIDLDYLSLCG